MIPEPNNMAGCPLCPPQHCWGKCGESVVSLYLWVAVLNSLFLRNTKHRERRLGCVFYSCPVPGLVLTHSLTLWLGMCFPVERLNCVSQTISVSPTAHKPILNTSPYYSRIKTWLGRSKDHILKFKMPYLQGKYLLPACFGFHF